MLKLRWLGVLVTGTFCILAIGVHQLPVNRTSLPLFVNTSTSLPLGFYRTTKKRTLEHGDILRTCLPDTLTQLAIQRGYLRRGVCPGGSTRIGKPVIALQGDTVTVLEDKIRVAGYGAFDAPVYAFDRRGRRLPNAIGVHILSPGECFLLSTHSKLSYDSRYYGPVPCGAPPYYTLTSYEFGAP